MYISLYDLGIFIIFIIIVIISSYLIAVLHRVFCMLGHVKGILTGQGDNISQIIAGLPAALENVNELVVSLKRSADLTTNAFGSLQNNLIDTVEDMRDGLETFVLYAKIIGEVCKAVFSKAR